MSHSRFINIGDRLLGLIVPKGANSYLKCIAGYYKDGKWTIETDGAVGDTYYEHSKKWNITISYKDAIKLPIRRFVVYRDPFERFVSLYNEKIRCGHLMPQYISAGLTQESSFEQFLEYAEKSYLDDKIEYHLNTISSNFKYEDIDDIVRIEDLDLYLMYHNISLPDIHINTAPKEYDLTEFGKYKSRVMALYQDDYNIIKTKKLWFRRELPKIEIVENVYATPDDFLEYMNYVLQKHNPTSILDLGSGNTTKLFREYAETNEQGVSIFSADHDIEYADNNANIYKQVCNKLFSYYECMMNDLRNSNRKYDFICIDGPVGYMSRVPRIDILDVINSDLLADEYFIFIHDAQREGEKRLIELINVMLDEKGIKHYGHELNVKRGGYLISSMPITKL